MYKDKIYDKIFPTEPGREDLLIFKNCVKCSWVELKNFVLGKNDYILENFVPDTIKNFEQIIQEKDQSITDLNKEKFDLQAKLSLERSKNGPKKKVVKKENFVENFF